MHSLLSPLPKVILFDADGTLFESERLHFESNRLTAKELHDIDLEWEDFDREIRHGTKTSPQFLRERGVKKLNPEVFLARRHTIFKDLLVQQLTPMPGLINFLLWCETNDVRRCIVSSSRRDMLGTSLDTVGIDQFFEFIIAQEDVSDGQRKPEPTPYLLALRRIGVDASTGLVIEDTPKGIAAAHAAGLPCVGILNDTNNRAQLATADLIISSYDELLKE